jgi:hypothetical protein
MNTPSFSLNDSLVYYTQVIDRELNTRQQQRQQRQQQQQQQEQQEQQRGLNYDIVQQQTKIVPYCTITNPLNDACPISQVQFDLIDCVMQINICKHNFNPYSLIRWLDSNSTCPMCRQNIDIYVDGDVDGDGDENTIYNNEESYRSQSNNENNYDDSDYSSVG